MADATAQANNGRRDMPSVSQAQYSFMHAAAEGDVKGVPESVGKEFVKADHGRKVGKLPKHVRNAHKRGADLGYKPVPTFEDPDTPQAAVGLPSLALLTIPAPPCPSRSIPCIRRRLKAQPRAGRQSMRRCPPLPAMTV
jgi:hypothetical protein